MKNDVKLNSGYWCDLVFEGRNKKYGAYFLRQTSWKRHIIALLAALAFTVAIVIIPSLVDTIQQQRRERLAGLESAVEFEDLTPMEEPLEEDIIRQEVVVPPPPLMATIQFTPPIITDEVSDEEGMVLQDELKDTRIRISIDNVDDPTGQGTVDLAGLVEKKQIMAEVEEKPHVIVQQMPEFPGGEAALMRWINSNIVYPAVAIDNNIQGRVILRFVVGKDGGVSNIEVLTSVDPSLDKEARRILEKMPKWIPGKQNGVTVPVYYTLPVIFRLELN